MEFLWEFEWDCGRSGTITGLFVATEKEIEEIIGKDVYFGEVLGKHSEIYGAIEKDEIKKIDLLDSETITKVSAIRGNTWSGYNPLEYINRE